VGVAEVEAILLVLLSEPPVHRTRLTCHVFPGLDIRLAAAHTSKIVPANVYIQVAYFRGTSLGSVAGAGVRYRFSMRDEFQGLHQGG